MEKQVGDYENKLRTITEKYQYNKNELHTITERYQYYKNELQKIEKYQYNSSQSTQNYYQNTQHQPNSDFNSNNKRIRPNEHYSIPVQNNNSQASNTGSHYHPTSSDPRLVSKQIKDSILGNYNLILKN